MKNIIKTTAYSAVALSSIAYTSAVDIDYGDEKVGPGLRGNGTESISTSINTFITYIYSFLYIIAFALILWAGFQILTAAGDEEKVKKGKTIMIQAVIGLIVIFLAGQITDLFFSAATGTETAVGQ